MIIPTLTINFLLLTSFIYAQDDVCPEDSPFRYVVRKDDCLFRLAAASSSSINKWLAYNPRITDENRIQIGWILCAPAGAEMVASNARCNGRRTAQTSAAKVALPESVPEQEMVQQAASVPGIPPPRRTAPKTARRPKPNVINVSQPVGVVQLNQDGNLRGILTPAIGTSESQLQGLSNQNLNGAGIEQNLRTTKLRVVASPVFPLQSPGFHSGTSQVSAPSSSPQFNEDSQPSNPMELQPVIGQQPTQFIQLPSSDAAEDAPIAIRPPLEQPRTQQKAPVRSPTTSSAPSMQSGSIDPNIVQCQFFDNGFLNCLRGCTVDEFQWDIDTRTNTKIMMRQCIENKPPTVHTWLADDGVLAPWLKPKLIPSGQAEKIVAACVFTRDRSFSCQGVARCIDSTFQSPNQQCANGAQWKGKTVEGEPLKQGTVLKGIITSIPQEDGQNVVSRQVRQVGSGASPRQKVPTTSQSRLTPGFTDCAQTAKVCLLMRDAALAEPVQSTCYTVPENGSLQRIVQPTNVVNPQFADISAKMTSLTLQRSECRFFGSNRYFCKGYTGDFCTKQGEQDDQTSIMFNECYLTDYWTDQSSDSGCPQVDPFIRTCVLMKSWDKDTLTSATCFEKQAGLNSQNSALARLPEVNFRNFQGIVDRMEELKVVRTECEFVGGTYYCNGYTTNYCDSQWENRIQSNFYDCHEAVTWTGGFSMDSSGRITA